MLNFLDSSSKFSIGKMSNDNVYSPRSAGRAARPAGRAAKKSSEADGENEGESKKKFPWALHSLLEEAEKVGDGDVVCWRPSGIAFKVHKRDEFMKRILPKYFKQTKFKSFVRQLNLWGFTFIDQGPDKGSYYHSKFVRGKQHLCHEMRRQKVKGSSIINPPTPYPQRGQVLPPSQLLSSGTGNSAPAPDLSIGPFDLGNERIDAGPVAFGRHQAPPIAYPRPQSQAQVPRFQLGPTPLHRNSSEVFFHTNQSNSDLMFQTEGQISEEPAPERGDWLDRLEAMFYPTDAQSPGLEQPAQGEAFHPSWLEPRPIRPNNTAEQKKRPPSRRYADGF